MTLAPSAEQQSAVLSWGRDDTGAPVVYVPFLGKLYAIGGGGQSVARASLSPALVTTVGFPTVGGRAATRAPDLALAALAPAAAAAARDNSRWFVGVWDCPSMNYGNVPPYAFHVTAGLLRFVEDPDTGGLRGSYDEVVDPAFPNFKPLSWTAELSVGPAEENGIGLTSTRMAFTDGSIVDAAGTTQGSFKECGSCLGRVDWNGTITFADGTSRGWGGLLFGIKASATAPDTLTINWRIAISPTTQQGYFFNRSASCSRKSAAAVGGIKWDPGKVN